jgi:ABC-type nitrate/sulfonate/bicarbonate transport system substrate-binding protein
VRNLLLPALQRVRDVSTIDYLKGAGARSTLRAAFVAGAALALSLPGASTIAKAETSTVTVSVLGYSATIWPMLVAQEEGYFADEGIAIDLVMSGSSSQSALQAASGSADIGMSSTFDAFRAIDKGAGLKVFLSSQAVATHQLFASRSITKVEDLKGKAVSTGGLKDITNLWWEAMARHFGLDPKADADEIYAGSTSARFAALSAGSVAAAVLAVPQTFVAEDQGFVNLGFVAPYLGELPVNVWYVNQAWAADHRDEAVAFVKANNRGAQFILDPANRERAAEILAKAAKVDIDVARKTFDLVGKVGAYKADGSIGQEGLETVQKLLDDAGDLSQPLKPIDAYFDGSYIEAAKPAG